MKNRIIYFFIAVLGMTSFYSCGLFNTGTAEDNAENGKTTAVMGSAGDGTEDAAGTTPEETRITGSPDNATEPPPGAVRIRPQDPDDFIFYLHEPTGYTYQNEDYRFSPDEKGFSISRVENGRAIDYGTARSVENEYYIVNKTATGEKETVLGRFDDQGNFTIFSYDRNKDEIIENTFEIQDPVNSE